MIPSGTVLAEHEEMEAQTTTKAERISQEGQKSPHAKRANVAAQWRKREEAIKASNTKSKARQTGFEEKTEANQELEKDSRQQEKSCTEMSGSKPTFSERSAPEPTIDTSSYKRSNIRDSWKKKAAASPYSSQSSPAFNELQNKWKKFGVHNDGSPSKPESSGKQITESQANAKSIESPKSSPGKNVQGSTKTSSTSRAVYARRIGSNRFKSRFDHRKLASSPSKDEKLSSTSTVTEEKKMEERAVSEPPTSTKESPIQSKSFNEEELFPPTVFPNDELISDGPDHLATPISPVASYTRQDEVVPTSPDSAISQSSLSSRANRRLRDIRSRNQPRREDSEEVKTFAKEVDVYNEPMPMDESTEFRKSKHSKGSSDNSPTSPTPLIPRSMEDTIPDKFFSEKDSHVDSFKTVVSRTSFGQLANDIREEAGTIFELDIVNEGLQSIQSTLDTLGFPIEIFQTQSSGKMIQRAPSPVEEVAIEVEYVADPEE